MSEPSGARRQNVSMAVAAILGVTVVIVVLLVTLRSSGDPDPGPAASGPAPAAVELTGTAPEVPEGDYDAFCAAALAQAADFDPDSGLEAMRTLLRELDIEQLLAVAPEGLRPALTTVGDQRDEVVATLEQVEDPSKLTEADFPAGFLDALLLLQQAGAQRCTAG